MFAGPECPATLLTLRVLATLGLTRFYYSVCLCTILLPLGLLGAFCCPQASVEARLVLYVGLDIFLERQNEL
jgi:hypothetical protein